MNIVTFGFNIIRIRIKNSTVAIIIKSNDMYLHPLLNYFSRLNYYVRKTLDALTVFITSINVKYEFIIPLLLAMSIFFYKYIYFLLFLSYNTF